MPGLNVGGMGTFVATHTDYLRSKGHKVTVITIANNYLQPIPVGKNLKIIVVSQIPANPLQRWLFYRKTLNKIIRQVHAESRIDVFETNEQGLYHIKKIAGIRYVIRLHGGHFFFCATTNQPYKKLSGIAEKKSVTKADAIIGVSAFAFNITKQYLSFEGKPNTIIPYPINTQKFYEANRTEEAKGMLLYFGSITPKKGIKDLIEAFALATTNINGLQLEIYGRDVADKVTGKSYVQQMQMLAQELGLQNISFKGPVGNELLPAIIEKAGICIFPSHSETQGIVVLEAMSMGKAVIFTNTGPGPETIEHEKDGMLFEAGNVAQLASQIAKLSADHNLRRRLGEGARKKVLEKYDLKTVGEQNISFYQSICTQ